MNKNQTVTIRLSEAEVQSLNDLTKGQLTRSQIIQILVRDFLDKPEEKQRQFLVDKLFGIKRVK